ncbi:MAG TPA: ABC transporter permease [Acidobacteriaceae bacterium]|jgi:predicted permease|nr:ABC transporter permease [Acidobacteriaceae bacterium]
MRDFASDLRYAFRMLIANPAFSLTAIAALALGIGANTAIFTVVDNILLKPLTYPEPDRMVQFMNTFPDGDGPGASPVNFNTWRAQTSVLQDVAAYDFGGPGFNLTGTVPEQVHGIHVSEAYFRLFGAPIQLGRTFTPQEDSPNGGHVVVISYSFWQRKFGANPAIIGTSISLSNEPTTIVGVLGKSFVTDPAADIWVPFQIDPESTNLGHYFLVAGRLKPGITVAQANAQLKLAADHDRRLHPDDLGPKDSYGVQPLRDSIVAGARKSLFVLLGAVGFVLLIACANVANLLLVRATGRKREFAIRAAMGATRIRVIRQLLTESIVLSVTGGVLGLILGYAGVRALLAVSPAGLPRIGQHGAAIGIDWRVLAFTLGVSLLTGVLFGLFPALGVSHTDLNSTLKESSNRSGTGLRHNKARSLLVISEVSLALILLIGAALLIRTFLALRQVNPGFDPRHILTLEMSLTGDQFRKTAGVAQVSHDGRERLNAIPGVEVSAFTCCLPLEGGYGLPFNIIGRAPAPKSPYNGGAGWMSASPGYFSVFHIPILRGRDFTEQDTGSAPLVVLINQTMAKKYWPKNDPVGQQLLIGKGVGPQFTEGPRQIIGVVGDIRDGGLNRDPRPLMIVPVAQVTDGMTALNSNIGPLVWIVRTHGDPHQYISAITEQLRQASGGFPVGRVRPMTEVVTQSTASEDFNMLLLSIFGASALVLAAIGIYGLMAYSVQQRTQEMGIRMALGADRSRIRSLVVWHGMRLALTGLVIGIGAAFGLTRFISSFLFGVKSWDPLVFATVPIVLAAVALLAVWMPATRASRLDPQQALRVE